MAMRSGKRMFAMEAAADSKRFAGFIEDADRKIIASFSGGYYVA